MRKIGLLTLAVVSILVGCERPKDTPQVRHPYHSVEKVSYQGHDYLIFAGGSHSGIIGIVHDPNCECGEVK